MKSEGHFDQFSLNISTDRLTLLISSAIHWSSITLTFREKSVRTCVSALNSNKQTQTSHSFIVLSLTVLCHYPGTGDYIANKHGSSSHFLDPAVASLGMCTCWKHLSFNNPPKPRPLLKLMKWKSPGMVWPMNMFTHVVCLSKREELKEVWIWYFPSLVTWMILILLNGSVVIKTKIKNVCKGKLPETTSL